MKKKIYESYCSMTQWVKRQIRNPRKRLVLEAIAVAAIIIAIISMITSGKKVNTEGIKEGVSYIKSLEKKDTSEIEQEIKEIKRAERKAALESGEINVWAQFNDSVILGDSRAVGFEVFDCVDDSRVFADAGATIRKIPEYIDGIKAVNPSSIILCFGINDMSIGLWPTCEEYITEYDQMIQKLQEALPDATVYVNSIIPATDPAFQKSEKWREIPDWNEQLKAHFEETGVPFIDITEEVEEHKDLYDVDGIHMRKEFYLYWGNAIIMEVTENE